MKKSTSIAAWTALAASGGAIAYPLFFRRWCLTWGIKQRVEDLARQAETQPL